jgi:hypothetical protein
MREKFVSMTDDELLEYLGLPDGPDERLYLARLKPQSRAAYERMHEIEQDIKLWQEGVGPRPDAILCFPHAKKKEAEEQ